VGTETTLAHLHLAALATYAGSCLHLALVVLPHARVLTDPAVQRRFLVPALRLFNPLSIGSLGVLLMTGAFRLTELKARLGLLFFARLGGILAVKLALAFLLINVATYVSFGIAHRLVRAEQGGLPADPATQAAMLRRMAAATWIALGLAGATLWVAVEMGRALH
jgi:uncharacterized membrane protein